MKRPSAVALLVAAVLAACAPAESRDPTFGLPLPTSPAASTPAATAPAASASVEPSPSSSALAIPTAGMWARVQVGGPVPVAREDHTWTVAEDGRTAYLFGGRDGGREFGDLWTFDLEQDRWQRLTVAGDAPAARFGHEAVWVPGRGLAVWAGQAGSTFFDDLWLFDPATGAWQLLPAAGQVPVARYGSCSGIGPDGRLWISHGFTEDGVRFADTRAYDFDAGRWSDEAPAGAGPRERCLHACWWTVDGRFALYGGQTTGVPALGDLWLLTPGEAGASSSAWTEVPGVEPSARQLAAVARRGQMTFMFGGRDVDRSPLRDTWLLVDGEAHFRQLDLRGESPGARSGAAMVFHAPTDRIVLFGGERAEALGDLWELILL